jgi:hypothetical protein
MKLQKVTRSALGLYSHPNKYALPPGALFIADDCAIYREGIVSKRRGFNRYGTALTNAPTDLYMFDNTLIVLDGSTLKYDSDGAGTWASWTGSYSGPDASTPIKALEANLSFFFNTSTGVFSNDATTGTPVRAGMEAGLDVQLAPSGTGASWFTHDTQVSYRLCWMRKDANNRQIRGTPTAQTIVTNPTTTGWAWASAGMGPWTITVTHNGHGFANNDYIWIEDSGDPNIVDGTYQITLINPNQYSFTENAGAPAGAGTLDDAREGDVTIISTLPSDVVAGDFYEVYRSYLSSGIAVTPEDRHYLVDTIEVAAGDVVNGYITYTDTAPEGTLSAQLYTNDTAEGPSATNDRPPWCRYMATYQGHTFYGYTIHPQQLQLQLLTVVGIVDDTSAITLTEGGSSEVYTFSAAENLGAKKFQRTTTFALDADNVEKTMQSFCKVVNRTSALWYAFYISTVTDPSGMVLIRRRVPNTAVFSCTSDSLANTGSKFKPVIPIAGTTVASEAETHKNGLYRSKYNQPEAVPLLSYDLVQRANRGITGLVALKESLLIFKDDGCSILTGQSDGTIGNAFSVRELDPTIKVEAPQTLATLDNSGIGYTTQGVLRVSSAGSGIVSRAIEVDLSKISKFTSFTTIAKAAPYEAERSYLFFTQDSSADTYPKSVWVWNYMTNAWTRWRKRLNGGLVHPSDGKLYVCHGVDTYVLQERKSYSTSGADFKDEDISCIITANGHTTVDGVQVSTATVTWSYWTAPAEGWELSQGGASASVLSVVDNGGGSYTLTLDEDIALINAAATLTLGYSMKVQWAPESAGSEGQLKQFPFVHVYPEQDGARHQLGFLSDLQNDPEWTDRLTVVRTRGWGVSPWGAPWGDERPGRLHAVRSLVARDHQVCRSLSVYYLNKFAGEEVHICELAMDYRVIGPRTEREP